MKTIALWLLLSPSSFAYAGATCEIAHRDHEWVGHSHFDIIAAVRELQDASVPVIEKGLRLYGEPDRRSRLGEVVRAVWVFEANRDLETIGCDGTSSRERQWEFTIVEVEWNAGKLLGCKVYRKSFVNDGAKPDPFWDVSPFDTSTTCEQFLSRSG